MAKSLTALWSAIFLVLSMVDVEQAKGSDVQNPTFITEAGGFFAASERYISTPDQWDYGGGAFISGSLRLFGDFYMATGLKWDRTSIKKGVRSGNYCCLPNATCRVSSVQQALDVPLKFTWRNRLSESRVLFPLLSMGLESRFFLRENETISLIEQHGLPVDETFEESRNSSQHQLNAFLLRIGGGMAFHSGWQVALDLEGTYHWAHEYKDRPHTAYEYNLKMAVRVGYLW